jgi:cell division protein FtsB
METKKTKTIQWLRRYFSPMTIIVLALLCYMAFFGETSVVKELEYKRIIDSLENEVAISRDSMMYFHELNERLESDPAMMEQVVREQYNMNRPNEDVYIFEK